MNMTIARRTGYACVVLCLAGAMSVLPGHVRAQEGAEPEAQIQEPAEEPGQEPHAGTQDPSTPEAPRFLSGANRTFQDVASDLFYWGQSATFTGSVLDNVFVWAQLVGLDGGTIGGDLFAFAASTTIDGEVLGDVYAFSSQVRIAEDAVVHGNLITYAGTLQIHGRVGGHVRGGGGGTLIDGDVGPVKIEAGSLTISETARIRGDLSYESNNEADIAPTAQIDGDVRWSRGDEEGEDEEESVSGGITFWGVAWTLWRYLGSLIVGTVLLLVGGSVARQPVRSLRQRPASGLGYGFVVAVVFPVACLVAIVLIVSLPLGVLGLVVFGLLLFLSHLLGAAFVGDWLLRRLTGTARPSEYAALALGLALLLLVGFIPYLGFLIRLVAVILGLGGIYLALRHYGFPSAGGSHTTTGAESFAPVVGAGS